MTRRELKSKHYRFLNIYGNYIIYSLFSLINQVIQYLFKNKNNNYYLFFTNIYLYL